MPVILMDQGEDSTAGTGGQQRGESFCSDFGKVGGEILQDQESIGLGDFTGRFVVLRDGLVVVPQVFLNDIFQVIGQVDQCLLDVPLVRPYSAADETLVCVCQMHE